MDVTYYAIGASMLAVLYGVYQTWEILKLPTGNKTMNDIADAIKEGANAFLSREYRTVSYIAVVLAGILGWLFGPLSAIGFLVGAICSAVA